MNPTTDNVLSVYMRATADDMVAGYDWYGNAHNGALALDPSNVHRAAGVIAAMSPMMPWGRNIRIAYDAYLTGTVTGGLKRNCAKAQAILDGADPLDVLSGNKVRSFYLNIADPSDNSMVTIDRHAFDIAVGYVTTDKDKQILGRKGMYDAFGDVYREAGRILDIPAPILQAITWTTWRNEKGGLEYADR